MLLQRMMLLLHLVLHRLVHSSVFQWVVRSDPKLLLCFHLEVHVPEWSLQSWLSQLHPAW